MRMINQISIHCSATSAGSANAFTKYHKETLGWSNIGYHYVILNGNAGNGYESMLDGSLEVGRSIENTPSAVKGHNNGMIAICLVGDEKSGFTMNQFETLYKLLKYLKSKYNVSSENIKGHREYPNVKKLCPCFNVRVFIDVMDKTKTFHEFVTVLEKSNIKE